MGEEREFRRMDIIAGPDGLHRRSTRQRWDGHFVKSVSDSKPSSPPTGRGCPDKKKKQAQRRARRTNR